MGYPTALFLCTLTVCGTFLLAYFFGGQRPTGPNRS